LKFLLRTRGNLDRNFKSAALAPHDFAVRKTRRFVLRRYLHPSHPALHVRDDAYAPPDERGTGQKLEVICPTAKSKNFLCEDWTAQISLKCFAKIVFWRTRRLPLRCDGEARPRPSTIEEAVGWAKRSVPTVDMPLQIDVVANRVLPISTLPNAFFTLEDLALRSLPRLDAT
jgi:hypothetical protein